MRIATDSFCFLIFAKPRKKNKSFLAVVATRFHQQIAKKYCHGIMLVNFSLQFLRFQFLIQRETHHLQTDTNLYFWLKASEVPVQPNWHKFSIPKTPDVFPAQKSSFKSTLSYLKVLRKCRQFTRDVLKKEETAIECLNFYQPRITSSRSNINLAGSETGATNFSNRIFVQKSSGLKTFGRRHQFASHLQTTPSYSISASGSSTVNGIKLPNFQEMVGDNLQKCGIVFQALGQNWPVFNDCHGGKGSRQYIFLNPGPDLITGEKKAPVYNSFGILDNFNLRGRSAPKAHSSHTPNDQRYTNFSGVILLLAGSEQGGVRWLKNQFAGLGITASQSRKNPVSEIPSFTLTRTYKWPQKQQNYHFNEGLNPDKATKSHAIDKHSALKKYPPVYLSENEKIDWLQSFDRPAQNLDLDWLKPKQLSSTRPMISSAAYNKGQQGWVGGRPLGFPPIANKLENRKVLPKPFFSAADQRIDRHGSDGKNFPRMRLLNFSQSAALIQKTAKKMKPEVIANPPKIGANLKALPRSELNGLVDRVYAQIVSRIKRERELRGR